MIILRGVPGAGKSTWVAQYYPDALVCSADHFFEGLGGYVFIPSKIGEAHASCRETFRRGLTESESVVIVDNTSTQKWEFAYYVYAAEAAGYDVEVVRLVVDLELAAARNVHGVPVDAILRMHAGMEDAIPLVFDEKIIKVS